MKRNMGSADRVIRIVLALVFAGLYFGGIVTGTVGIILLVLGGVFLATATLNWCGIYALVGLSTCSVKEQKS